MYKNGAKKLDTYEFSICIVHEPFCSLDDATHLLISVNLFCRFHLSLIFPPPSTPKDVFPK